MINFIKVQRTRLEIIYRITMKRIAKGYTAEQLSNLIAREPGYINSLELLQIPLPGSHELQKIAWALGEADISCFFPKTRDAAWINVLMEKEVYGHTLIHTCDIINDNEKEVPFFFLQEEIADSIRFSQN